MEISPAAFYEGLRRYWRRRRYQRLHGSKNNKRKLKIARLGGATRWLCRIRTAPKLKLHIVSPFRILARFHDAYVDMMIHLANGMGKLNNSGLFKGKKVTKDRHISVLPCGEEVDSRLVLEIYKRLAASHELRDL